MLSQMVGIRGKSGPPANQNAFKHGLAGISQRRVNGALNPIEQSIRENILAGFAQRQRKELWGLSLQFYGMVGGGGR